jgi:S1-C subfamily serine protease
MRTLLLACALLLASCQNAGEPFDPLEALAFIENEHGQGSGFFISPTQVVTAWHVIESGGDYTVTDSRGSVYKIESFNHILYTDAAILTLSTPSPVTPAKISCVVPKRLDKLIVAGAPMGIRDIVTIGYVAGWRERGPDGFRMLTTGMTASGMSGGPVYNERGEAIGITVEETMYNMGGGRMGVDYVATELNGVVPLYDIVELCKEEPSV